ncbi:hypothetical protein VTK26DRAFT_2261 [Humicola hyalothermophila]
MTFAASQPSTSSCPLANCDFRNTGGGGWVCCVCGGANTSGWCNNMSPNSRWEKNAVTDEWEWIERCDHGCCRNCAKDSSSTVGDSSRKESRKGKDSRKRQSAREGGPLTLAGVDPLASFNITLDYRGKDGKGSLRKESRKKEQKARKH